MCVATVASRAFLTYQVRMMMAVLFLVGQGLEEESVIPHMLDIPEPLVLFDSLYEGLEWKYDLEGTAVETVGKFHNLLNQLIIR